MAKVKKVIFADKENTDKRFTLFLQNWYWEKEGIDISKYKEKV